jgi:hypothetical protein
MEATGADKVAASITSPSFLRIGQDRIVGYPLYSASSEGGLDIVLKLVSISAQILRRL